MHVGHPDRRRRLPGPERGDRAVTLALNATKGGPGHQHQRGFLGLMTWAGRGASHRCGGRYPGSGRHHPGHPQQVRSRSTRPGAGSADCSTGHGLRPRANWGLDACGIIGGDGTMAIAHKFAAGAAAGGGVPRPSTTTLPPPIAASASTARWRWWPRHSTGWRNHCAAMAGDDRRDHGPLCRLDRARRRHGRGSRHHPAA